MLMSAIPGPSTELRTIIGRMMRSWASALVGFLSVKLKRGAAPVLGKERSILDQSRDPRKHRMQGTNATCDAAASPVDPAASQVRKATNAAKIADPRYFKIRLASDALAFLPSAVCCTSFASQKPKAAWCRRIVASVSDGEIKLNLKTLIPQTMTTITAPAVGRVDHRMPSRKSIGFPLRHAN
jgi:hypothetical protein